ncbi:MAG: leucyl aminopeptidase [Deltaproteobacteria bacterium]|nr:leucyl aminopeptidase [Deltaproteobacteria bacterium]
MKIRVENRDPAQHSTEVLALPIPELETAGLAAAGRRPRLPGWLAGLDRASGGRIAEALAAGEFQGKRGECCTVFPASGGIPVRRILLIGLGPKQRSGEGGAALRHAAAQAVRAAAPKGRGRARLAIAAAPGQAPGACQPLAEGALLGAYRFDRYQSGAGLRGPRQGELTETRLLLGGEAAASALREARAAARRGQVLAESQNLARDLSNEPPNILPPRALAQAARKVARETGMRISVLGPTELRRLGMGAMLAVAQGSANPPCLIALEHNAPPRSKAPARKARRGKRPSICLVGKGVCFDSGGLSLKPPASMVKMKHDMSGGAAVIGAMRALALQNSPLHAIGIVGAVENMPSGTAYRVDDIVQSASGLQIEVSNTDAEGRLVLADCIHYARTHYAPDAIVDLATLTGACVIALGHWAAAAMGNHEGLRDAVVRAGEATGERYWPLPLWEEHREHMRGRLADLRQTGGREAGSITAGAFISHFAGDTPWCHLDIAGVADTEKSTPLQPYGATGFGVRSVAELVRAWEESPPL